jgi:hypothetical protein
MNTFKFPYEGTEYEARYATFENKKDIQYHIWITDEGLLQRFPDFQLVHYFKEKEEYQWGIPNTTLGWEFSAAIATGLRDHLYDLVH